MFTVVARNKAGAGPGSRPSNKVRTKVLSATPVAPPKGAKTSWWKPGPGVLPWRWEIDHPLSLSNATDMGTNDTLPNGQVAPAPKVYDIDGIINPPRAWAPCRPAAPTSCATSKSALPATTTRRAMKASRPRTTASTGRSASSATGSRATPSTSSTQLARDRADHRGDDQPAVRRQGLRRRRDRPRRDVLRLRRASTSRRPTRSPT